MHRALGRLHASLRPWLRAPSMLVALARLAAACGGGSGDDFPELEPFPPELEDRVLEIRDRASEVRGLPPHEGIVAGTLSRNRYDAYLRDSVGELDEETRSELEATNIAYRLLHLLERDEDLLESVLDVSSEGFVGLYYLEQDRLVLIDDDDALSRSEELTLAHEYVHSFQDAAFDRDASDALTEAEGEDGAPVSEYSVTLSCLLEGDASVAEDHYAEAAWGEDWRDVLAEESSDGGDDGGSLDGVSLALLRYFAFDYVQCPEFVAALYEEGGWEAVNQAYLDPPATTEQILHVEKYFEREPPAELPTVDLTERLGVSWEQLTSGAYGEFDVFNHLVSITGDWPSSQAAAAGWGAGRAAVYRDTKARSVVSQDVIVHISTEWDSELDLTQYLTMLGIAVGLTADKGGVELLTSEGPARWSADGDYGYLSWDKHAKRADLLIATGTDSLDLARTAVLTHSVTVANDSGESGLEALALTSEDISPDAVVAREEHVRAEGAVAAFERQFEPAGNLGNISLGESSVFLLESHVALYDSEAAAAAALGRAAGMGLSPREAGDLLTRLAGANVSELDYRGCPDSRGT